MTDAAQGPGWWQASDGGWYPPEAHPGYRPPPPPSGGSPYGAQVPQPAYQAPYQPAKVKKSHGCLTAFLIVGALLAVLVVVVSVAATRSSDNGTTSQSAAPSTCAAYSYPDKQSGDHCAAVGMPVMDFGQTVTLSNMRRVPGTFNDAEICADVSYVNRSKDTQSFNVFDWKLQTPKGVVQSFELTNATLQSGDLVAGGSTSGSVCFKDNGEKGQFVVIWKPKAFRADRGVWVSTF